MERKLLSMPLVRFKGNIREAQDDLLDSVEELLDTLDSRLDHMDKELEATVRVYLRKACVDTFYVYDKLCQVMHAVDPDAPNRTERRENGLLVRLSQVPLQQAIPDPE